MGSTYDDACASASEFFATSRKEFAEHGTNSSARMKDPASVCLQMGVSSGGGQKVYIGCSFSAFLFLKIRTKAPKPLNQGPKELRVIQGALRDSSVKRLSGYIACKAY